MNCPRCQGLMIPIQLLDTHARIEDRWYSTGQCVNCSYTHFPQPQTDRKEVTKDGQETSSSTHAHERQGQEGFLMQKAVFYHVIEQMAFNI